MKAPVLSFADYNKPFLLETDASKDGLGAVLLQKGDDGKYHPIAYRSKALSKSERNYHSLELEFLALKWAVTKHFREYLQYLPEPFLIRTNNNPDDDVKCLPDGITIGAANRAELHNPHMQQAEIEDNIRINVARLTNSNTGPKGEINVVDWAQAQWEDPELEIAIQWIKSD